MRAVGTATGTHARAAVARRMAKDEANRQRDLAVAEVRAMRCPQDDPNCDGVCRRGRTMLRGSGTSIRQPRRAGGMWEVKYTSWRNFDVVCRCSG